MVTALLSFYPPCSYASSSITPIDNPSEQDDDFMESLQWADQHLENQIREYTACVDDSIQIFDQCVRNYNIFLQLCQEMEDSRERIACLRQAELLNRDCMAEFDFNLNECEQLNPDRVVESEEELEQPFEEDQNFQLPIGPDPIPLNEEEPEQGLGKSIIELPFCETALEDVNSEDIF